MMNMKQGGSVKSETQEATGKRGGKNRSVRRRGMYWSIEEVQKPWIQWRSWYWRFGDAEKNRRVCQRVWIEEQRIWRTWKSRSLTGHRGVKGRNKRLWTRTERKAYYICGKVQTQRTWLETMTFRESEQKCDIRTILFLCDHFLRYVLLWK